MAGHSVTPQCAFFAGHVEADTVHGARGFKMAEKYCDTPELQAAAVAAVAAASHKRWQHMNGLYWYTLYGRTDDTPAEEAWERRAGKGEKRLVLFFSLPRPLAPSDEVSGIKCRNTA